MSRRAYNFLPETLVEVADAAVEFFGQLGYTVRIDAELDASPSVPTIYLRRNKTEKVVIVCAGINRNHLLNWTAYGHSTGRDFRVCCVVPADRQISQQDMDFLRGEGIGLFRERDGAISEDLPARDLAVSVSLPLLRSLPKPVRRHVGSAYEQFARTHWREGFEDACQALENLARSYLIAEIRRGRVAQFIGSRGSTVANAESVERMTLGQLARAFAQIPNQNRTDAQVGLILQRINRDRIGVVHRKNHAATESRLRKNVGMHMWSIIEAIKMLC